MEKKENRQYGFQDTETLKIISDKPELIKELANGVANRLIKQPRRYPSKDKKSFYDALKNALRQRGNIGSYQYLKKAVELYYYSNDIITQQRDIHRQKARDKAKERREERMREAEYQRDLAEARFQIQKLGCEDAKNARRDNQIEDL